MRRSRGFLKKKFSLKGDCISKRGTYWVLEGDWGGQIYLSVRANAVSEKRAFAALWIVDVVQWTCNNDLEVCQGACVHLDKGRPGRPISGGMGGGMFAYSRIWMHDGLNSGLKTWVEPFLFGEVDLPSVEKIFEWLLQEDQRFHHWSHKELYRLARVAHARASKCLEVAAPEISSNVNVQT